MNLFDFKEAKYLERDTNTPTFSGTVPSEIGKGGQMLITVGDKTVSVDINPADGSWSWTPPTPLEDGYYNMSFQSVDKAGNVSTPSLRTLIVDTTPPAAPKLVYVYDDEGQQTGMIKSGDTTDDRRPTLTGIAQKNTVVYLKDGDIIIGSAQTDQDGMWTIEPERDLNDGKHNLTLVAKEEFAKKERWGETSEIIEIIVETRPEAPPTTTVRFDDMTRDSGNPYDWRTNDGSAGRVVSGTLSEPLKAGETLKIYNGVEWKEAKVIGNRWTFIDDAAHDNSWDYSAVVSNEKGAGEQIQQHVVIDKSAPGLPADIILSGSNATIDLKGSGVIAGDKLNVIAGNNHIGHILTQAEIDSGKAVIALGSVHTKVSAALTDQIGNSSNYLQVNILGNSATNFNGMNKLSYSEIKNKDFGDFTLKVGSRSHAGGWEYGLVKAGTRYDYQYGDTWINNWVTPSDMIVMGGANDGNNLIELDLNEKEASGITFQLYARGYGETFTIQFIDINGAVVYTKKHIVPGHSTWNIVGARIDVDMPDGLKFNKIQISDSTRYPSQNPVTALDDIQLKGLSEKTIYSPDTIQTITAQYDDYTYFGDEKNNIFKLSDPTVLNEKDININGGDGIDTLQITTTTSGSLLDVSKIVSVGRLSSVEIFDINGGNDTVKNTLNLNINDILELGQKNIFVSDGRLQVMVKGDNDVVTLDHLFKDQDLGNWVKESGNITLGGQHYQVFHHQAFDAELLVQDGVTVNLV
ncbi:Ig-like domain-containing protein [Pantoea dispersa]|uniref:Ig-like domain-containing protein n=1 Tax=Pantoea dispersa TaxID=59814 RepID=UPI00123C78EC|nr:Ig-like domain-containing protein [Pantoea dispersa]KAA8673201.1 hypothetical protein F4W08_04470 [Pantoea dispersa]